jgi:large subunit ribosomal protein L25
VEVKCLPGDLVSHIDVDISVLEVFDQFIRLHDLVLPAGIALAQETNEAVVGVMEIKIEEEAPKVEVAAPVEGEAPAEGQEKEAGNEAKAKAPEEKK